MRLADEVVVRSFYEQGFQHPVDRFAAACDQGEGKLALKGTGVLCLSRKQTQCTLQFSAACRKGVVSCVILTSDQKLKKEVHARIDKANAALRKFYDSVATKRDRLNHRKAVSLILICSHEP